MKKPAGANGPALFENIGKRRLKVCHATATAEGGTWLVDQLRELRDSHQCDVVAVVPLHHGSLIENLAAANIRYHTVDIALGLGPLSETRKMFRAIVELVRFFRRERFDVVQTQLFLTLFSVRPAAWIADVPVRAEMIASPYPLQAPATRSIERLTGWMDSVIIPTSNKTLELCREARLSEKRLGPIIYYGPDERIFDPASLPPGNIRDEFGWPLDTPVVCMAAYFYPALPASRWVPKEVHNRGLKAHDDLVRAAPIILREFPKAKFLLIGSGWSSDGERHLADVRQLVAELHLEDSVIFAGYRRDVNRFLRDATVAVQVSLVENLGGTMEALLMETPLVATRNTGMVDSVRDGETGVLVNPSDPKDLARGILELLRDPKRARTLAEAGRRLMLERFTLKHTAADLAELYERLLSGTRRRKFYRPLVSCLRTLVSLPVLLFIVFRFLLIDLYIPFYLRYDVARVGARLREPHFSWMRPHFHLRRLYYFVRYSPYRVMDRLGRVRSAYRKWI